MTKQKEALDESLSNTCDAGNNNNGSKNLDDGNNNNNGRKN